MLTEISLFKAIKFFGNKQTKLAKAIGEKPDKIRYWLNSNGKIPFHNAIAIELATNGLVSRFDLAPYARFKNNVATQKIYRTTISEQIAIGIAFENSLIMSKKIDGIKGRTDVLAAQHIGFGNHVSYRQAKKVCVNGIFKLIVAMDTKKISISCAAALADLSPEKQEEILQHSKKEIIEIIKKLKE